jgi:hypothetical protein
MVSVAFFVLRSQQKGNSMIDLEKNIDVSAPCANFVLMNCLVKHFIGARYVDLEKAGLTGR